MIKYSLMRYKPRWEVGKVEKVYEWYAKLVPEYDSLFIQLAIEAIPCCSVPVNLLRDFRARLTDRLLRRKVARTARIVIRFCSNSPHTVGTMWDNEILTEDREAIQKVTNKIAPNPVIASLTLVILKKNAFV